jgi:multidrug efflux pump
MIFVFVGAVLFYYMNNNRGTEFFVESEPENAIVYVLARGNLSIEQKDALVNEAERVVLQHPNVLSAFAFAGDGGLNNNTGGAQPPRDAVGQVQLELVKWEDRPTTTETWFTIPLIGYDVQRTISSPQTDGDRTIDELSEALSTIPGMKFEVLALEQGPASAKPVHLRLKSDNWDALRFRRPAPRGPVRGDPWSDADRGHPAPPGIDWQIDVDVEKAGRFGADVATVGAMVQLVTRGILLDTMRVPSSDEEIDIRVRLPEEDRVLSTLDTLKVRTGDGLVPLSNFVTRQPVEKLAQIDRINQTRFFDVKAGVEDGLVKTVTSDDGSVSEVPITANERIEQITPGLKMATCPRAWNTNGPAMPRTRRNPGLPHAGLRGRAGADVHHPAGAVQLGLQRRAGAAGGGAVDHGRADRDAGDEPAVFDHHDRARASWRSRASW